MAVKGKVLFSETASLQFETHFGWGFMAFKIDEVLTLLKQEVAGYQVPVVDLIAVQTQDPYRILVATILSARTKDETTAGAAQRLFRAAPDLAGLATLDEERIAGLIYPVGFYKNKAGYLARLPGAINELFGGVIPDEVESLTRLPGVGRKTANLVVSVAFKKPAICVDTHVHRIMNIWGYVHTKTPLETEMALRAKLPQQHWLSVNSILVAFGQGTCKPLRPHCDRCVIGARCPRLGVTPRRVPEPVAAAVAGRKRLVSWNVNGLRAVEKKGFADIVNELDADIVALQEIKAHPEQLSEELKNLPGYQAFWFPASRKGYSGVAVYSRLVPLGVSYGINHGTHDGEGRVLTLEFDDFFLVNTYFPNAQHGLVRIDYKLQFNEDFLDYITGLMARKSVLICGDFNVAHREIDLKNPKENVNNAGFSAPERAWMDRFLAAGFIDTFRIFNQEPGNYTWWSYRFNARARNIGWRIDYFCVDAKSAARVSEAAIHPEVTGSDHCPVSLTFV